MLGDLVQITQPQTSGKMTVGSFVFTQGAPGCGIVLRKAAPVAAYRCADKGRNVESLSGDLR